MNESASPSRWERWTLWLDPLILWAWLMQPRVRLVLAWMIVLTTAGVMEYVAWTHFNTYDWTDPKQNNRAIRSRNDGNNGHTTIDFGGQWLMGRMLVEGHGHELYNRKVQREVLDKHYPRDLESPDQDKTDTDQLMEWLMGSDYPKEGEPYPIGGPLYPPVNAFYFYPLGLMEPRLGYRIAQLMNLLLAFLGGYGVHRFSKGRIWWPVAAFVILIFPGFSGSHNLGQNATFTLTLLIWGWVYVVEEKEWAAGLIWGLLAFKPVWAMTFLLYPLLTRRWRMVLAMGLTGLGLILLTLPFVGVQSWQHWLKVGKLASEVYDYDENWITLSRDLLSLPRRYMLDFSKPHWERVTKENDWPRQVFGWALLGIVFETTIRLCVLRRNQARTTGRFPAAFLLLSCWLLCFHFMYYDALLTVLPILLLFLTPDEYFQPRLLLLGSPALTPATATYYEPSLATPDNMTRALLPPLPSHADTQPPSERSYPDLLARLQQVYPLAPVRGWSVWVVNRLEPLLVLLTIYVQNCVDLFGIEDKRRTPWNLFGILILWVYCAWCWLQTREAQPPPAPLPAPPSKT